MNAKASPKTLKWITERSKSMLLPLCALVLVCVSSSICSVVFAKLSQNVVDAAVNSGLQAFFREAVRLCAVIALEIVLKVVSSRMSVTFGGRMEMNFRNYCLERVLRKKWSAVNEYHSGDIMNRIKNDVNIVTSAVVSIVPTALMLITRVVGAIAVLFTIDSQFAIIMLCTSPFILFFGRIYSKKMKHFHKSVQASEGKFMSYALEALQNMIVIKAFGNESATVNEASQKNDEILALRIKRNTWRILASISMTLLFTGGYAFAILWGAYKLSLGVMTFGSFTAMIQLVNQVQTPFQSMSSLFVSYQNMIASAERIMELEALPDEDALSGKIDREKIYSSMKAIVFKDIDFSYANTPVLKNASCRIEKGEFVAISGISGVGKSTLIRLLLCLIEPQSGEVYLDCGEKLPVTAAIRPMFGYVPQGNMLISGSIEKNITFYGDNTDEEIIAAAQVAQIDDVIAALPDGLDSLLGEKGLGLSEGQIQRVAIARAIARSAPILLLDEATSALDEATEIELLKELRRNKDKTVMIITHRPNVLEYCDKVIKIENGTIRED